MGNEELRQDSVVRFCEALTKRIREAITILGSNWPKEGLAAAFNEEHNVIRVLASKYHEKKWSYSLLLDNGEQVRFDVINDTAIARFRDERFRLHVFQVEEMYRNGDIHFSKNVVDYHPSGLSTGFNRFLDMDLSRIEDYTEYREALSQKVRWVTQVCREQWASSVYVQRKFDQDLKLVNISTWDHDERTVAMLMNWSDGSETPHYFDRSHPHAEKVYNQLTSTIFLKDRQPGWIASYMHRHQP